MGNTKAIRTNNINKFPSFGDLFENIDTPYLQNFQKYIFMTGIFDQISDDFKKTELNKIDMTQINKQENREHLKLLERWNTVLKEAENIKRGRSMKYQWQDLDHQMDLSTRELKYHHKAFNKKKAEAISAWRNFIEKLSRLYKYEIVDTYQQERSFDSYFIHVPKVKGSSCECIDNKIFSQSDSFSIEFVGLGGSEVIEVFQEEGLVTIIEDGECCKIKITVQFFVQVYNLYRLGKLKKKGAWAKPITINSISPVTIDARNDTCGQSMKTLKRKKDIRMCSIDTRQFKRGLSKKTLKLTKKMQTKGGISLKLPIIDIEPKIEFTITNTAEKSLVYTLPKGYVYTYYTVPNAIGYSWTVT